MYIKTLFSTCFFPSLLLVSERPNWTLNTLHSPFTSSLFLCAKKKSKSCYLPLQSLLNSLFLVLQRWTTHQTPLLKSEKSSWFHQRVETQLSELPIFSHPLSRVQSLTSHHSLPLPFHHILSRTKNCLWLWESHSGDGDTREIIGKHGWKRWLLCTKLHGRKLAYTKQSWIPRTK